LFFNQKSRRSIVLENYILLLVQVPVGLAVPLRDRYTCYYYLVCYI
jgi:hypothetical protein